MGSELKTIEYESKVLTTAERRSLPGKFVEISGGQVHYELDGPKSGRKVVDIGMGGGGVLSVED